MNAKSQGFPAISLPGLTLDTLGLYFSALGLLRIFSRRWPSVRGCWRKGCFVVVNGPASSEKLEEFLYEFGLDKDSGDYGNPWGISQKKDTKLVQTKKPARHVALWRAREAMENQAVLQQAHIATGQKLNFNPLFGSGGNAGQRKFARGWEKAKNAITSTITKQDDSKNDLHAFLNGKRCRCISDFSAGSWFSAANKVYNSGLKPSRNGQITPWAMLFACEAFPLLAGSPTRQLGAHRRAYGAFPFVTRATAPLTEQAAGQTQGEFWAPVWKRPMSLAETGSLFQSGRAEIDGRAALTSAAFAGAIMQRGVDAGLSEFRNFVLIHTTSDNTFESRLSNVVRIPETNPALNIAIQRMIGLRDNLPRDVKNGTRWRFRGLQGQIDRSLISLAEAVGENHEFLQVERSWKLIDEGFTSLAKVDRNKVFRRSNVRFELLPLDWLAQLLERTTGQHAEIRLALALASLRPEGPSDVQRNARRFKEFPQQFLAYRLGSAWDGQSWRIPKDVPLRRTWSPKTLTENLIALGRRRLFEVSPKQLPPFRSDIRASVVDSLLFLSQEMDEDALCTWIDRFSLFDWSGNRKAKSRLRDCIGEPQLPDLNDSDTLLYSFFRPLFDQSLLQWIQQVNPQMSDSQEAPPNVNAGKLSLIVSSLERGDVTQAWEIAFATYQAERIALADFHFLPRAFSHKHPDRLLASLFFPVNAQGLSKIFARWRSP